MAQDIAKTPVTEEEYAKLGERTRQDVRVVRPMPKEEYDKLSDAQKLHWYPEAQGVSAAVYAQLGAGMKERGLVYPQLKWYEYLTSVKEEEGEQVTAKSFTLQVGDAVVPFMYTARNWNTMADWEKGVHLFADAVFTVTYLAGVKPIAKNIKLKLTKPTSQPITTLKEYTASGQLKVMQPTTQAKMEYQALQNMAKEAGAARADLRLKIQAIINAEKAGIMPKNMALPANKVQQALMNNLENAGTHALKADTQFAKAFTGTHSMSPKQLKQVEKLSGVSGLKDSVKEINTIEAQLKKQWTAYEQLQKKWGADSFYTRLQLRDISNTHALLEKAYASYAQVIKPPRIHGTPSRMAEGFGSTIRRGWGKLKGSDISIDVSNEKMVKQQLYELKKLARRETLPAKEQEELYKEIATIEKRLKEYKSMQGDDIDEFMRSVAKGEPGKPAAPEGQPLGEQLRARLDEVIAKEKGSPQERFWEKPAAVATKEKAKVEQDIDKLWKAKQKAAAKEVEEAEKVKAPKIEEEPKFGMKPKEKVKLAKREIPAEARGRMTYAQIAREYGEQALDDAIGVPIGSLSTAGQLKTAIQINQEFETKLAGATNAATKALINTYTRTHNMNKAEIEAQNALDNFLKTQPAAQTKLETKTQVAVDVAVKEAVREIIRMPYRVPPPKFIPGAQDEGLQIERVEGIKRNPGIVSFNKGIVGVELVPPYQEGTSSIHFTKLKKAQTGKGSQEATLKVRKGRAPDLIVLSRTGGIAKTDIIKGKRMRHYSQRGPGIMDSQGRVRRQRRGSIIY